MTSSGKHLLTYQIKKEVVFLFFSLTFIQFDCFRQTKDLPPAGHKTDCRFKALAHWLHLSATSIIYKIYIGCLILTICLKNMFHLCSLIVQLKQIIVMCYTYYNYKFD